MGRDDITSLLLPASKLAQIADISPQRLSYWERTELVRPTIQRRLSPRRHVRLYDLQSATEVLVVAQLVQELHLLHIRRVLDELRAIGESDQPLRELRFAVFGNELIFQRPNGTWSGSRHPKQLINKEWAVDLKEARRRVTVGARRPTEKVGRTERVRRVHGSRPVFAGTRVPVDAVMSFVRSGASNERILEAFPILEEDDIESVRSQAS